MGRQDTAYDVLEQVTRDMGLPQASRLGRLQVAAVLALAGLPDSAMAVVGRVKTEGSQSPYIPYFEANVRVRLGQNKEALDLLEQYLEILPQRRAYIGQDWWWEPLRSDPRFKAMIEGR